MGRKEKRALKRIAQAKEDIKLLGDKLIQFDAYPAYAKYMEGRGVTRQKIFRELKDAKQRKKVNKEILWADAYSEGQRNLDLGPDLPHENPDGSFNGIEFVDEKRRDRNRQQKLVNKSQRNNAIKGLRRAMVKSGLSEDEANDLIRGRFASATTRVEDQIQAANPPRFPVQMTYRMAQDYDEEDLEDLYERNVDNQLENEEIDAADQALIYERDVAEPARRREVQQVLGLMSDRIVAESEGRVYGERPFQVPLHPGTQTAARVRAALARREARQGRGFVNSYQGPYIPTTMQQYDDHGFLTTRSIALEGLQTGQLFDPQHQNLNSWDLEEYNNP